MIQQEKSGDYGDAIRGDEQTAAWARQTDLSGTEAGRVVSPDNKVVLTVGAVLIATLILLCFRLAYDGVKQTAGIKGFTGEKSKSNTTAPVALRPDSPVGMPRRDSLPRPTPLTVILPVAPPIRPAPVLARALFQSPGQREEIADLLLDCRAAYDTSGDLAAKWMALASGNRSQSALSATPKPTNDDSFSRLPEVAVPLIPTAREWNAVDTQMEAISTAVVFATRPALYPPVLQTAAAEMGSEMRTYLQTTRIALSQTDAGERAALQARADAHRQKAGEWLTVLENAVRTGTASPAL